MTTEGMNPTERRAAYSLAGIYALRMLGLFMILPVFALYAGDLEHTTPALIGLAIGMYGLTQAVVGIPFGMASDRFGRKPVIIAGLVIFALGSVVAALADSIWGVILGRALQGSGAIAAVVMALAADLTREEHRVKVMAFIGTTIGLSFSIALVFGPLLDSWIGVSGIFWLTAVLAIAAIPVLQRCVPQPVESRLRRDAQAIPAQFKEVFADKQLLRLDAGIFVLHLVLTANFVVIPLALRDGAALPSNLHWMIYLAVMVLAIAVMFPFVIRAEKQRRMKQVFVGAVVGVMLAEVFFAFNHSHLFWLIGVLILFFAAFNILEATLPSLIAKTAPPDKRGTAMGIYSSSQFMGAFVGGVSGGYLYGAFGMTSVFLFCAAVALLWLLLAKTMDEPRYVSNQMINVGKVDELGAQQLVDRLLAVRGVVEAVVIPEDGVAYLKVDRKTVDQEALQQFSAMPAEAAA